jgi:DNA-binding Lrp family transcriptional regulator
MGYQNLKAPAPKETLFRIYGRIRCGEVCMPMAYVLINTEPKYMESVIATLEKLDSVEEIFPVYGVYDVVAKVKADSMAKLKEIVTWKVRSLKEVRSTITMLILEEKT